MMKRIYFILSLLFAASLYVLADDCSDALNEAKNLYNNGNYQKAKALFEYVKSECGSNYGEATNWIARCEDALTPKLSLSRTRVSVGPSSGSATITVTSNRTWVLKNTSSNLFTVSKSGNTITIQYHSNSSTSSQSDYFDVETTDGAKSVRVNFYQEPRAATSSLSVSTTSISCSASGTTEYITVNCNTTWEVQYPSGSMYSVTRSGNTLTVRINENTSSESRSDFFNVKTTDGSKVQKIQLSQDGRSALSVSKTSISCSASGTTEYITVTSSKSWEVQYPSGSMYSVTRSGNTLTVRINENTSSESRSDFFNVKTTDGSKVQKIELTQSGRSTSNSYATINNISVDHNVYENGYKGMKIHVKFDAYNVYNHNIKVCVYFAYEGGNALKGKTGSDYITPDGKVTVQKSSTANYTNTTWNDFTLFMPYTYLNMQSGCNNVSLEGGVGIYDSTSQKWLTNSNKKFSFTFSN